jgi:hypothetical protein
VLASSHVVESICPRRNGGDVRAECIDCEREDYAALKEKERKELNRMNRKRKVYEKGVKPYIDKDRSTMRNNGVQVLNNEWDGEG